MFIWLLHKTMCSGWKRMLCHMGITKGNVSLCIQSVQGLLGLSVYSTMSQDSVHKWAGWSMSSFNLWQPFYTPHTIVVGYYGFTLDVHVSVHISFPDDNLSKHHWIFTKLGMCIDIEEILFGLAIRQLSLIFDRVICPRHTHIFVSRR